MADALDPRLVYSKTAAGVSEVMHRGDSLSPPARRVLVLVDGKRPLSALPATVRPGELPKLIDELLSAGMIALSSIVDTLPGPDERRDPRLEDFKRRIEGAVLRELGPAGSVLEARLQDCVNLTVLRSVMREVVELVRARADDAAAERVAAAAQAAGRASSAASVDAGSPRRAAGSPPVGAVEPKGRPPGNP